MIARGFRQSFIQPWGVPFADTGIVEPLLIRGQLVVPATVARNSLAWDWNSQGILQQYAINTPVIGYNPATGALRGLQVEKVWINSLLQNRNLAATWTNNGATKDATGADGVADTAWTFTDTDDASQAITVSNNSQTNILSWLISKGTDSAVLSGAYTGGTGLTYTATLDTSDGSAVASGDAVADDITVTDSGDWWRLDLACANNSTGNTTLTMATDVDGGSGTFVQDFPGIYLNSSVAGPPIVTGASAVTRAADDISITSIPWYNQSEGTFVARFARGQSVDSGKVFSMNINSTTDRIDMMIFSNQMRAFVAVGSVGVVNMGVGATLSPYEMLGCALAYKLDDYAISSRGSAVASDTSATVPTVDRLMIGRVTTIEYLQGWIKDLTYYPIRLPNAQLQALSA